MPAATIASLRAGVLTTTLIVTIAGAAIAGLVLLLSFCRLFSRSMLHGGCCCTGFGATCASPLCQPACEGASERKRRADTPLTAAACLRAGKPDPCMFKASRIAAGLLGLLVWALLLASTAVLMIMLAWLGGALALRAAINQGTA